MITRLKITNFLLIDNLELDFNSGFTVVTGETGSGKSIIVDALMLIFGARASSDIIRIDQLKASLEAEFSLSNADTIAWLRENDLLDIDAENMILCRRVLDRNGRNKFYINGTSATALQMRTLGEFILDIHTQHASITLVKNDMQLHLLDEYAGITDQVSALNSKYRSFKQLEHKMLIALTNSKERTLQAQSVREKIEDISSLNFTDNEWQELEVRHKQLTNASMILQELNQVLNTIEGDHSQLLSTVVHASSRLGRIATVEPRVVGISTLLESVEVELREIVREISDLALRINEDPEELSSVEKRINQIFEVSRKYRTRPELLLEELASAQNDLESLGSDIDIAKLEEEIKILKDSYKQDAALISKTREKVAALLSKKVTALLTKLAISGEFGIELIPNKDPSQFGMETVNYQIAFNKGMPLQPLAKVVSGGELSRTALALYLMLSAHNPPEVIIFDEIDVGIGGKVAALTGQMLSDLGRVKQVICITHQPQTAGFGDHHLVVNKDNRSKVTTSNVDYVSGEDRVSEIARMLGGINVTAATLNHAREMLHIS